MLSSSWFLAVFVSGIITTVYNQSLCNSNLCVCSSGLCANCISSVFYLNSIMNRCQICHYRCDKCSSNANCLSCASGYFYSDNAFSSPSCTACPVFCRQCSNQAYCNKCIDGFVAVNGICKPCAVPNVLTCQSQMTVSLCQPSFWKNGDSCSPCRQFCQSCTSSTNCLACIDGYRVQASAGTYCASCPLGCKTCSSTSTCTVCLKNYRLISGSCISIENDCKNIQNCQQCEFSSSSTVQCKICAFPYYLSQGQCITGASLLCTQGATGQSRYQCLNGCGSRSESIDKIGNQYVCSPKLWVPGTDIKQHYFQAANSWSQFANSNAPLYYCNSNIPVITSGQFSNKINSIVINKVLKPYYKLIISVRILPIYKSISSLTEVQLTVRMKDNSTVKQQYSQIINTAGQSACRLSYFTVQSKLIKDQNVTISFQSALASNITNISEVNFTQGLIGYSQILIQLYRCSPQCRICSNSKYCTECYGTYFVYQNQCVDQCYGFFEFYAPNGNPFNYTYKSCLQKCPDQFFSSLHPFKPEVYICLKCLFPCLKCKSQGQCLSCEFPYLYYDLGLTCLTKCPLTHYSSIQNNMCIACISPCRTCLSSSVCLSCSIGFYYPLNNSCVNVCPVGYFANSSSRTCQICDPKCVNCTNSPANCQACIANYYLLVNSCVGSCPALTHYKQNGVCQICKPPCLQCSEQTKCLNCISGYLLNSWCYNSCPTGYYGNFTTNSCEKCIDVNCVRCISNTACQVCSNSTFQYNSQCLQFCPPKTFGSIDAITRNNICAPCLQPCYQCINSSFCLSCQIGYLSQISVGKCVLICENSFFPLENINSTNTSTNQVLTINRSCQICHKDCFTCKNYDTCLSCLDQTKVLTPDFKCSSSCPFGYYNHNKVCQLCNYPCLTCQNSPQNCLSCSFPYIMSSSLCVSQCGVNQYESAQRCYPCKYPCKTCKNDTSCTSCTSSQFNINQTYLWQSSCLPSCPLGSYADTITLRCKACNYPCQTCQDSRKCLTCSTGYLNKLKKTCQMCPQTTFPNEQKKQCQLCSQVIPNCKICSTSSACRFCMPSFFLYLGQCFNQAQCKSIVNYYPNMQQMMCLPCIPPCGKCFSENQCQTCITGYLFNQKCLLECPNGYYAQIISNSCQPCNLQLCLTCSLGPTNCLSCNLTGSKPVLMPSLNTCISGSQCPSEYFIDHSYGYGRCTRCQPPCLACSSVRVCNSCITGILFNGQCKSSCPISFYQNSSLNSSIVQCYSCSSNCLKCRNSADYCVSCSKDKYLQVSKCVDKCDDGFYLDSSTLECKKCSNPCLTCISPSSCISCLTQDRNGNNLTNTLVYFGQCLQKCPDGTYEINESCIKCPQQCQICSTIPTQISSQPQVFCRKCSQGLYMNSTSPGKCSNSCELTEYSDSYTRSCYNCQSPCITCQSATLCNSCQQGYIIYHNDCVRGVTCPENTYKYTNPSINISRCLDTCEIPYYGDKSARQCVLDCPFNQVKFSPNAQCLNQCPTGYYLSIDYLCQKCSTQKTLANNQEQNCSSLLKMDVRAKSIFNSLFIRLNFNQQVDLSIFQNDQNRSSDLIKVVYKNLSSLYSKRRLLQVSEQRFDYVINPIVSKNTLWVKILTQTSLDPIQLIVALQSHYIFAGKTVQNANSSIMISGFDKYSEEQIKNSQGFQTFSKAVSYLMCFLFIINLIFNTGYLMYSMIDFYQLLFILLFLNVDYPPNLNYFLYGFRYSHFLFLPQIFKTGLPTTISQNTPEKFGIIVPDAVFLNNTGHYFLIMFAVVGLFFLIKVIDFCMSCFSDKNKRSNKIKNQQQNEKNSQMKEDSNASRGKQKSQVEPRQILSESQQTTQDKQNQGQQTICAKIHKLMKVILDRIRWNYFNDFLYLMYFYLVLFAFCQTYDMTALEGIDYASTIFSIIFIVLGIFWPIGLIIMLVLKNNKNQIFKKKDESGCQYYSEYKCFVANVRPKDNNIYGLISCPIRYFKKLLLSILFCYCSNYENFIIGVIIMTGILSIIITLIYRPFKNKVELVANCIVQGIFSVGCICLSVLMSENIQLTIQRKQALATFAIVLFLLVSVLICFYNFAIVTLQTVSYFLNKNYLGKYDQVDTQIDQKQAQQSQNKQNNQQQNEQNSNLRLNITMAKNRKYSNDLLIPYAKSVKSCKSEEHPSQQSGLDIYLRQRGNKLNAPQVLIKCIKGNPQHQETDSEESQDHQDQNQMSSVDSHYKKVTYPSIGLRQKIGSNLGLQSASQNQQDQVNHKDDENLQIPNIFENNPVQGDMHKNDNFEIKAPLQISDCEAQSNSEEGQQEDKKQIHDN